MILRAARTISSDDDKIQRGQLVLAKPKRLANDPANSIPLDPFPATFSDTAIPRRATGDPLEYTVRPKRSFPRRRPRVWMTSNSGLRRIRLRGGSVWRVRSGEPGITTDQPL